MILTDISLSNFRIHRDTKIDFSENLNYIVGGNGQGKTTILDSIYYLCTTKSHDSRADSEAVSFNEEGFELNGNFKDLTESNIKIIYSLKDNKKVYLLLRRDILAIEGNLLMQLFVRLATHI